MHLCVLQLDVERETKVADAAEMQTKDLLD